MTLLDPQSEWARLVVGAFAEAGVRDVVLSPGSRSTPFALAAAHEPRLRIRTILDERAAAFFALGQARVTGAPSLLLCTSGSAPAHYLPAIIEAHHARLPLLVLTADRPLEAQHAGAYQTIDQTHLFGGKVRAFFELGGVDAAPSALRGVRRLVAQAFSLAQTGAVHLNARVRKPLEPYAPSDEERAASTRIRVAASEPLVTFSQPVGGVASMVGLRARIVEEQRGIIAVGPQARHDARLEAALVQLAARTGYALVTEPTSQLRVGLNGALSTVFVGNALAPRVVIQIGPPPVAASYERIVAHAHLEILAASAEVDADSRAHAVHVGDPAASIHALLAALELSEPRTYGAAVAEAYARIGRTLASSLEPGDELASVLALARVIGRRAATLFVGNSLPVRELATAAALGAPTLAHHQRGASGIDGLCAGAAGIASMDIPTVLLLGDVSLLHDLHGLWIAGQCAAPLVVAVVCNGGGRIFDTLPIGRREDLRAELPLFNTPVAPDLATLARFCAMTYVRTEHAADVEACVDAALDRGGPTLLELVVVPDSAARWSARLPSLVEAAS